MITDVMMPGISDSELPERGMMPSGVVFLGKPFTPRALRERVQSLLPQRQTIQG